MSRMEHSWTPGAWMTRREREWKAYPDSREFRKSFHGAVEKTRKKWKTEIRKELELAEALDVPGQADE